jgi:CheY-like chemotaxis protein
MLDKPLKRARIAVIDDDAVFLELMQDLLGAAEGHEVLTCSNWLESQAFVTGAKPDLVILDLMMGREQTGWGVLELLRTETATRDIPVIICSAAAPALEAQPGWFSETAAVELLAKPFDVDQLLAVIGRLLETRLAAR